METVGGSTPGSQRAYKKSAFVFILFRRNFFSLIDDIKICKL
jgi:hypothetical protein